MSRTRKLRGRRHSRSNRRDKPLSRISRLQTRRTRRRARVQKGGSHYALRGMRGGNDSMSQRQQQSMSQSYEPEHIKDPPCHPAFVQEALATSTHTCMSPHQINKIRDEWNKANPDATIDDDLDTADTWKQLQKAMNETCENEYCWTKQKFIESPDLRRNLRARFRPEKPSDWELIPAPNSDKDPTWLDSDSIFHCLQQLAQTYPWFKTIYPSPVDYDAIVDIPDYGKNCVTNELCNLDVVKDLTKHKKTAMGVVMNLDKHDKPGSHWVALYIDLVGSGDRPMGVFYWDSYGMPPPKRIQKLMDRVEKQMSKSGSGPVENRYNKVRHQRKDAECGMYSLYFVTEMMGDRSFDDICNNIVIDDDMKRLRDVYFAKDI